MAWEFDARKAARGGDLSETGAGSYGRAGAIAGTAAGFMAGVYRWMTLGLAVTAGVALYTASNVPLATMVARNIWLVFGAQFVLVLALTFMAQRLTGPVAALMFMVYAGAMGLTMSGIFFIYPLGSIGVTFLVTAGAFAALSLYGTVTKRDLGAWGTFLFMGLVGVVIASIVSIWWHNPAFNFALTCAVVVVFAGLTAYDTQKLRMLGAQFAGTGLTSVTILGALNLYLDFINLFIALLRLFGGGRQRE
ncbi:MAG TPA: Bax inhibitor-1/YccA family protein [Myxococcaceae bacterium]|nr:Bax inhibitor-1/YccA family protein [Myxococcaceae bacterium]